MASQRVELIHTPNYEQIKTAFLQELIRASQNKSSSISFVKQQRSHKPLIKEGVVQGIVIGGTNYVLSTEEVKENGKRNVLERKAGMLPVFDTKKTFEDFLSEHLDSRAYAIGINFGFKLDPVTGLHGALDGKIIAKGTKDHAFIGTTEPIGAIARNIFKNRYNKEIPIAVTNDAVALLFAGDGTEEASLIAGTGFNMGMRIDNTLINLEAGGFDKFP
ncbi:MAG TPA: hypothetical protein VLF93_02970, partial [Candidatus Saccharimonadales bacterium]|nr:hypothetical protein [Candidatus Saccharimonadales bacterium]